MTDLEIRKIDFSFDEAPFCWLPDNPKFAMMANAISFLAVGFEKFIVASTRKALPLITDPVAHEEADAFLKQEAQHSKNHRKHLNALIARYPGLQETLDEMVASYDRILDTEPLEYQLAYTADLEATFTPIFKVMLDHERDFFRRGDERVASLFLWHFVEEVEHRSSALVIYNAVVGDRWYRTRVARKVFGHVMDTYRDILRGFDRHVPEADRRTCFAEISPADMRREEIIARLPLPAGWKERRGVRGSATFAPASNGEMATMFVRLLLSQSPWHKPAREPLPLFADDWFEEYRLGRDVTQYYSSGRGAARPAVAG